MPTGIPIGEFTLRFYGMIIMLGAVAAALLSYYRAKRRGLDTEFIWDGFIWALVGGIIGARLWHVFTPTPSDIARGLTTQYYLTHPLQMLKTWDGGLGIPGAVIGGALAVYILARRRKTSFAIWVDVVAPGLALAQAIGRWGNFINQEL
ncbi:MAG: prolipoprotein diacylglyceryl transferase, partial [Anaerolineales bacterium]|nr:prolipoprotein diacylglyceryl transferase [Anaerolineales bacterium]